MAKTTKTTKNNSSINVESSAPVVPIEPKVVVDSLPVPPSVPSKKSSKKTASKKEGDVTPAVEVVVSEVTTSTVDVSSTAVVSDVVVDAASVPVVSIDNSIVVLLAELAALDQQEIAIQQQRRIKRRLLEKAIVKVLKANSKATSKKNKRSGNRQPSGFIRPTLISDELATFLGRESGTELARTAVTNQINTYIKLNNLKDSKNGRQINADAKLSTLLKLGKDDVLTYFNLQKYMKHHFVKKTPVVEGAEVSVPVV